MKIVIAALIVFSSTHALALGDLERGLIFIGNSASGGTYLADLESQKARINLDYERRKAENKLQMEKSYQNRLRQVLQEQVVLLEKNALHLNNLLQIARSQHQATSAVNGLIEQLYSRRLSISEFLTQLEDRTQTMQSLGVAWNEVLLQSELKVESNNLSAQEVNALLLKGIDLESEYGAFILNLESQLAANFLETDAYKKRIGELP